jgi:ATP-binding cassette subfamily B protein
MGDSTVFLVAQRISAVLTADQIIVLEEGKIVAKGAHKELLATSPEYRSIYESQLGPAPNDG